MVNRQAVSIKIMLRSLPVLGDVACFFPMRHHRSLVPCTISLWNEPHKISVFINAGPPSLTLWLTNLFLTISLSLCICFPKTHVFFHTLGADTPTNYNYLC